MRIRRVYNVLPSKDQDKDWKMPAGALAGDTALPESVDLRQTWWPAGSQGSTGACVGFAVGEGLARYHFTKAGRLPAGTGVQWRHIWMASKEEDILWRPSSFIDSWGTYVKDALDIVRKHGCVPTSFWSASNKTYTGTYDRFYLEAAKLKILSYVNLGGRNPPSWRNWLATQGPVVVRLDVDRQFERVLVGQTTPLDNFVPGSGKGHAVCLVGYQANGNFIVRNSWSQYWGDKGHVYVTERYAQAAFDEAYGVTV